jgi:hypothetical protein
MEHPLIARNTYLNYNFLNYDFHDKEIISINTAQNIISICMDQRLIKTFFSNINLHWKVLKLRNIQIKQSEGFSHEYLIIPLHKFMNMYLYNIINYI